MANEIDLTAWFNALPMDIKGHKSEAWEVRIYTNRIEKVSTLNAYSISFPQKPSNRLYNDTPSMPPGSDFAPFGMALLAFIGLAAGILAVVFLIDRIVRRVKTAQTDDQ
jgi:hypothetical protein